jgi:UDP-3-O-[3-hydroxymyristoyl] glucosamine N-acyltransferase
MKFKAEEIALFLNGKVIGDPETEVSSISKIEEGKSGSLAFLANPKYENYLYDSDASVILVNKGFIPKREYKATLIVVEDAYQAFASLLEFYMKSVQALKSGIEQPSYIDQTVSVGEDLYFGAFAYAGKNVKIGNRVKIYPQVFLGENVIVGDDTVIYAGVKIYDGTRIGSRCILHAGVVIGSDGFGFVSQSDGTYKKIPQVGTVILEDDVEIGANTTIDCGTMDSTIIRKGVKLDNLIQVGHNCDIGDNTVMAAHTGLAGSTKVGKGCRFAGQVGLAGHITIGDNVQIGAQSGVTKNVKSNEVILGSPAIEYKHALRMYTVLRNLPQLRQEVIDLRKTLSMIKESQSKKPE